MPRLVVVTSKPSRYLISLSTFTIKLQSERLGDEQGLSEKVDDLKDTRFELASEIDPRCDRPVLAVSEASFDPWLLTARLSDR